MLENSVRGPLTINQQRFFSLSELSRPGCWFWNAQCSILRWQGFQGKAALSSSATVEPLVMNQLISQEVFGVDFAAKSENHNSHKLNKRQVHQEELNSHADRARRQDTMKRYYAPLPPFPQVIRHECASRAEHSEADIWRRWCMGHRQKHENSKPKHALHTTVTGFHKTSHPWKHLDGVQETSSNRRGKTL